MTCAADKGNAFLYAKTKKNMYVIASPEFGKEMEGKPMLIDKGLHGLRTSSLCFHEHLSDTLWKLRFSHTKVDGNF